MDATEIWLVHQMVRLLLLVYSLQVDLASSSSGRQFACTARSVPHLQDAAVPAATVDSAAADATAFLSNSPTGLFSASRGWCAQSYHVHPVQPACQLVQLRSSAAMPAGAGCMTILPCLNSSNLILGVRFIKIHIIMLGVSAGFANLAVWCPGGNR